MQEEAVPETPVPPEIAWGCTSRTSPRRRERVVRGQVKITPSHLSRLGLVYVRQSSLAQVRDNTESTARQYGLVEEAARLGWAASAIEVIDADLGLSGRSADNRAGFKEVVADGPLLDGLHVLIHCDIQLDVTWSGGPQGSNVGDGGGIGIGEFELGECCMPSGRLQHVGERGDCRSETSVDHGEVEIGRVAILSEMYEAECRSALEDQASTVRRPRLVQLGDDVGEDVIPFHDPSVDSVGVGLANDRVASEHLSVSDDGSKLIHCGVPGNAEGAVNPLDAVIARVEADDRLSRSDRWLQSQGQR